MIDEADPISAQEHTQDEPGSFIDVYRSLDTAQVLQDEEFVDKSVREGVVPESVRYGVMHRAAGSDTIHVFRGVVKAMDGSMHYFNWSDGTDFKLVKADDPTKQWEAERYYKACSMGCDMRKGPVDVGESVEEDAEEEKAGNHPAAVAPMTEERHMQTQDTAMTTVHPGAARGQTPDDPTVGRDWHQKAISKPGDGVELDHQSGEQHWTTAHLVKAWGQKLQNSAPRLAPRATPEEAQYMREVLGASTEQISKGMVLPPRHRVAFEQWRTSQLRGRVTNLEAWLERNR